MMADTASSSRGVPDQVKQLCRMVAYGFYGKETGLIVDHLCKVSIIKEDDLCETLRMEKKNLRSYLASLKNEHIIKTKMSMEVTEDGTNSKSTYYFIEYPSLLNLVKYKLELMRKKLETQVKTESSRSHFVCPGCQKHFTDLDTGQLLDTYTLKLFCTICGEEVEEIAATSDQSEVKMAVFNEKLNTFFDLVREIDSLNLSPEELQTSQEGYSGSKAGPNGGMDGGNWSNDRKGIDYNYIPQAITINIGSDSDAPAQKSKELPTWLAESTVVMSTKASSSKNAGTSQPTEENVTSNDLVLSTLMRHESKVFEEDLVNAPDTASDDDDFEDVDMDGEDHDEDEVEKVKVGGQEYLLDEITADIVELMTEDERNNYIRIGQEAYNGIHG